ncbi:MAG: hypothetical protein LKI87_02975, partial [Prevotella sp.]
MKRESMLTVVFLILSFDYIYAVPGLQMQKAVSPGNRAASAPVVSLITHRPPVAQRLFRSRI